MTSSQSTTASTMAVAPRSSRPHVSSHRMPWTGGSVRDGSARRRSPGICTAPTSPTLTCSSAPRESSVRGIREPQPQIRPSRMTLQERLAAVLDDILPIQREDDGALTVHHDETFASLRVVTIAEGLDMVSLTQILVWDLPVDAKVRNKVARHARDTLLGTVSLIEKSAGAKRNSKKVGDVLLRYNFPAAGLT